MSREKYINGEILLINKPLGWSSFNVVKKIKYLIQKKYNIKKIKIGHSGTLDPFATGVLAIAIGEATKSIELFNKSKTYEFYVSFGFLSCDFLLAQPRYFYLLGMFLTTLCLP